MIDFELRPNINIKCTEESVFGFEFFKFRSPEMAQEMDRFIEEAQGKKCFLDIGAYHGIFSLAFRALNPQSRIHAFEPVASLRKELETNVEFKSVWVSSAALSDVNDELDAHLEWDMAVIGPSSGQWPLSRKIRCVIGDDWVDNMECEPDFLKIDVEGHEIQVLRGLSKTITKFKPTIFLEVHSAKIEVNALYDLIASLGYSFERDNLLSEGDHRLILRPK